MGDELQIRSIGLMTVTEQLRKAIEASGKTLYRIGQDARVNEATLRRLMEGRPVNSTTFDKLAAYFAMELQTKKVTK